MAVLLVALPESPVFLLSKGQHEEAAESLKWLRGANGDISRELAQISDSLKSQSQMGRVSVRQIFTRGVYSWPLLIMMGLFLFRGSIQ